MITRFVVGSVHRNSFSFCLALATSAVALGCSGGEGVDSREEAQSLATSSALSVGVRGDMGGDGRADIALAGGVTPGGAPWTTIPVAHSNGDGSFGVTNGSAPAFALYATQSGAKPLACDFNGDGRADVALTGGRSWSSIPVAFSNADGSFRVTNLASPTFALYATQSGATPVAGDFNGDGLCDIALSGGSTASGVWTTIPVAFSNGDGTFRVTNLAAPSFALYATQYGAKLVSTDINGDGRDDLALTGGFTPGSGISVVGAPWTTIPVALSRGDGSFNVTNEGAANFAQYATQTGALVVGGDIDGDGRGDLVLAGGSGWNTVPVAFSNGNGTFRVTNTRVSDFPTFAAQGGAQLVAGDFNSDGRVDLALAGGRTPSGAPWSTIPVAFSNADGTFRVTNAVVAGFPLYATQASSTTSPTAVSSSNARWAPPAVIR